MGIEENEIGKAFVVPAIDLIEGKCVRLTQGDYGRKTVYDESPLDVAKCFEDCGIKRLHLVDLDGARQGNVVNWKPLEAIASKTRLLIDFGGGIHSEKDVAVALDSGAWKATVGSIAHREKDMFLSWLSRFGPHRFFIGADVKEGKIAVNGWLKTTDETVETFLSGYLSKGANDFFCTDVSKDGKLEGPSVELYKKLIEGNKGLRLTASGGVATIEDLQKLKAIGCTGAIVGKAIYENKISLPAIMAFEESLRK